MQTLFSEQRFVAALCRSGVHGFKPVAFRAKSGAVVHGVEQPGRFGERQVYCGPLGLYASPGDVSELVPTVKSLLGEMESVRTLRATWTVRYDHGALAAALRRTNMAVVEVQTRVLALDADYDKLFANFSTTRRRQIRRAREAVTVREVRDPDAVRAYYALYRALPYQQSREADYPLALFLELSKLDEALFLVAEHEGTIIGGGLFLRDADSLFYFNSAADRAHSELFATCAMFEHAIRFACAEGLRSVNLGASARIPSLDEFKASWGAQQQTYWRFSWTNSMWRAIQRARAATRQLRQMLR